MGTEHTTICENGKTCFFLNIGNLENIDYESLENNPITVNDFIQQTIGTQSKKLFVALKINVINNPLDDPPSTPTCDLQCSI